MKTLTVVSKLGHYQADLTQTPDGVEVKMWACMQDGGPRKWMGTDMIDAPWHFVANHIHDSIYGMVPHFEKSAIGIARKV
jgi:hypothetical protein